MPKSDDSSNFDLTSSVGYAGSFDAAIAIAGEIGGVNRGVRLPLDRQGCSSSCHGLTHGI